MINILHDELCGVYFEVLRSHLMILRKVVYRKLNNSSKLGFYLKLLSGVEVWLSYLMVKQQTIFYKLTT